jgi:hypothetical protein
MNEKDELPTGDNKREATPEAGLALPAQLGRKLRNLFAEVESQPVPERMRELLDALAAKEKKPG